MKYLGWIVGSGIAVTALFRVIVGCGITPKQAGDATDAACTVVEALTPDQTVESVCAMAPEVASIVAFIASTRADAGPARYAERCKLIPTTTVCATNAETLAAVRAVKAKRAP